MFKAAAITLVFAATPALAQVQCMGFLPETTVLCEEGGVLNKVHGYEEPSCGAGRDGVLNETIPIRQVDGPTWMGGDENAQVTFVDPDGHSVTFKNCVEVEI